MKKSVIDIGYEHAPNGSLVFFNLFSEYEKRILMPSQWQYDSHFFEPTWASDDKHLDYEAIKKALATGIKNFSKSGFDNIADLYKKMISGSASVTNGTPTNKTSNQTNDLASFLIDKFNFNLGYALRPDILAYYKTALISDSVKKDSDMKDITLDISLSTIVAVKKFVADIWQRCSIVSSSQDLLTSIVENDDSYFKIPRYMTGYYDSNGPGIPTHYGYAFWLFLNKFLKPKDPILKIYRQNIGMDVKIAFSEEAIKCNVYNLFEDFLKIDAALRHDTADWNPTEQGMPNQMLHEMGIADIPTSIVGDTSLGFSQTKSGMLSNMTRLIYYHTLFDNLCANGQTCALLNSFESLLQRCLPRDISSSRPLIREMKPYLITYESILSTRNTLFELLKIYKDYFMDGVGLPFYLPITLLPKHKGYALTKRFYAYYQFCIDQEKKLTYTPSAEDCRYLTTYTYMNSVKRNDYFSVEAFKNAGKLVKWSQIYPDETYQYENSYPDYTFEKFWRISCSEQFPREILDFVKWPGPRAKKNISNIKRILVKQFSPLGSIYSESIRSLMGCTKYGFEISSDGKTLIDVDHHTALCEENLAITEVFRTWADAEDYFKLPKSLISEIFSSKGIQLNDLILIPTAYLMVSEWNPALSPERYFPYNKTFGQTIIDTSSLDGLSTDDLVLITLGSAQNTVLNVVKDSNFFEEIKNKELEKTPNEEQEKQAAELLAKQKSDAEEAEKLIKKEKQEEIDAALKINKENSSVEEIKKEES